MRSFVIAVITASASLALSVCFASIANAETTKPNIVVIMAHDLGAGWVDYDGSHPDINTPNLERLAKSGMVFTKAYAAASVCSPTRAACITGMSPAQVGMTTHIPGRAGRVRPGPKGGPRDAKTLYHLPLKLPSYARELKKQGSVTGFIGKWHLAGDGSLRTRDGIVSSAWHPEHYGLDSNIGGCALGQARSPPAQSEVGTLEATYSAAEGIGAEEGVMRRDPSDIIKVDGLYYVWYSKGTIRPGYDATVWYATSPDGRKWTEKGIALAKGKVGTWEGASVFTPNILVVEGRYWLFYTGTSRKFRRGFNPDSKIGIAVSDSPAGPWERLDSNPALKSSDNPADFDSHLVDDACLIKRRGKYWLYYKGRQLGKSPAQTQPGLAIADKPQGPYIKYEGNPVIPGNHEVLVWPQGDGVAALIGTTGPKEWVRSIVYSQDGVHFTKTHAVKDVPHAAGAFRPEAFTDSNLGRQIQWGVHIGKRRRFLPFIERFDLNSASQ